MSKFTLTDEYYGLRVKCPDFNINKKCKMSWFYIDQYKFFM